MAAEIIDGKAVAQAAREQLARAIEKLTERRGRAPRLDVVLVGEDPASQVYVRNKERAAKKTGIEGHVHRLDAKASQIELMKLVAGLNADDNVSGILVQLPLPGDLDAQPVLDLIDPRKDVDGLHPINAGLLAAGRPGLRPCTPSGCMLLLDSVGYELEGKHAVVVGRSALVGKPLIFMLLEKNATVTVAHSRTRDLGELVGTADVVIAAVGKPKLIEGAWLKEGAAVLDVGINRVDGKLVGDVDFETAKERAGFITPVPGGVGPMTIAVLLHNTLQAAMAQGTD